MPTNLLYSSFAYEIHLKLIGVREGRGGQISFSRKLSCVKRFIGKEFL